MNLKHFIDKTNHSLALAAAVTVEELEQRTLRSASGIADLSDGVLRVTGTRDDDTITIKYNSSDTSKIDVKLGLQTWRFDAAAVMQLRIDPWMGNDYVGVHIDLPVRIDGGAGNDTLVGSTGDDTLIGKAGNDSLRGDAGDDSIDGGDGADRITGGDDTDTVSYASRTNNLNISIGDISYNDGEAGENDRVFDDIEIVNGGGGADTLTGNASANTLDGGAGNDQLHGAGGDDSLQGSDGDDSLDGGAGADIVTGGNGFDMADYSDRTASVNVSLDGSANDGETAENDQIDADGVIGGSGNDTLSGNATLNWLVGNAGNDNLYGGDDNDTLDGGDGNDMIDGGDGPDEENGDAGDDIFSADYGRDSISGGDGNDLLSYFGRSEDLVIAIDPTIDSGSTNDGSDGGPGRDRIQTDVERVVGGSGNDSIAASDNGTLILGYAGNDTLIGGNGNDNFAGGDGNDALFGLAGSDFLDGGNGDDVLQGGLDDDNLLPGAGADLVFGGGGIDTANYLFRTTNQTINLDDTFSSGDITDGAGDYFASDIENAMGGSGDDSITGNDNDNRLMGLGGDDTMNGGNGTDTLDGGDGNDFLIGGEGVDSLFGFEGNDTFMAMWEEASPGTTFDQLYGGNGNDVFVVAASDIFTPLEPGLDFNGAEDGYSVVVFP